MGYYMVVVALSALCCPMDMQDLPVISTKTDFAGLHGKLGANKWATGTLSAENYRETPSIEQWEHYICPNDYILILLNTKNSNFM
jgi:hypothetical protein